MSVCKEFLQILVEVYEQSWCFSDRKRKFEQHRKFINREWRKNKERCHQDIEVLVDKLVAMRVNLRELEHQAS